MDKAKVTALLKQIDEFSGDADKVAHDDALRRKLVQASRKLSQELETPAETWQRIAYLARNHSSPPFRRSFFSWLGSFPREGLRCEKLVSV